LLYLVCRLLLEKKNELPEADTCCGFGGTFSVKNPDVSAAMCTDKVSSIRLTGAEYVCATDNSCLMHIGGSLSRQRTGVAAVHLAEILAGTDE
jgi:L-lactate dehydrogenase complex protein LldE